MTRPTPLIGDRAAATSHGQTLHAASLTFTGLKIQRLVDGYRLHGVSVARTNPLRDDASPLLSVLCPTHHGLRPDETLAEADLPPFLLPNARTVADLCAALDRIYGGTISVECAHVRNQAVKTWLWRELEERVLHDAPSPENCIARLKRLIEAETWEHHLQSRFPDNKRFSLEGCESLLTLLDEIVQQAAFHNVREIAMGMPHRGRVNAMVNFLRMPAQAMVALLRGAADGESAFQDLKYHLGGRARIQTKAGPVDALLAHNPSHLEAVTPVALGMARAMQDLQFDGCRRQAMAVILHGDAAFTAQGIVMESLNLAATHGFTVGGALHVVINNQIGFTTSDPKSARSSAYCTDIARFIDAPVIHVNADDPDRVALAAKLAVDYRMKFGGDVVLDLIGYRRRGHNEQDEPSITQPRMQSRIERHPSVVSLYESVLVREGLIGVDFVDSSRESYLRQLSVEADAPAVARISAADLGLPPAAAGAVHTSELETAVEILAAIPDGFNAHPTITAMVDGWKQAVSNPRNRIDWRLAENLAYATLLASGGWVRLTGMDVGRGTFCHRQAVWHDQGPLSRRSGRVHIPLRQLAAVHGQFDIFESPLSEAAVLGFEYGYSVLAPHALVVWEAQYGDFVNNAQVVVDQFISAGEAKWGYKSRLAVLLPHGHEGWGPEHSNGHLGRFLQLCAGGNMRLAMPSTSSQWFHLLREQATQPSPTPLIAFTPKSMLYSEEGSHSQLSEFTEGRFAPVIDTFHGERDAVSRVVICSGKVAFDLEHAAAAEDAVAVVRLEQLHPFPSQMLKTALATYTNVCEVVWAQEEHLNHGAWRLIRDDLENVIPDGARLRQVSRPPAAQSAGCDQRSHHDEQRALVRAAVG